MTAPKMPAPPSATVVALNPMRGALFAGPERKDVLTVRTAAASPPITSPLAKAWELAALTLAIPGGTTPAWYFSGTTALVERTSKIGRRATEVLPPRKDEYKELLLDETAWRRTDSSSPQISYDPWATPTGVFSMD